MEKTIFAAAELVGVRHLTDATVVAVCYGEAGFYPIYTRMAVDELNPEDVTPEIVESAVIGSMFGWNVPGAALAVAYFVNQG